MKQDEFFVAFFPIPAGLKRFLGVISVVVIAAFGALALAAGATQDNPGDGNFRFDFGRQTVTGVIELKPYPTLRITEGNDRLPIGHTLMLSAGGKRGIMGRALDGLGREGAGARYHRQGPASTAQAFRHPFSAVSDKPGSAPRA